MAVRRVQHPARVPARRARLHRRVARSRSRGSSATAPRCCSRCRRRRCRRSASSCARATAPGYFVMNGTRVRGRLHRRVADRRDRGDGPRRRGEHHPPQDARSGARGRAERTRSGSSSPRRSAPNIDPYIAAGHAQLDDVIDPADTRAAICAGLRHQRRQARRPPGPQARRAARLISVDWRDRSALTAV